MSGICGIINFDGAPVDPALLQKMAQAAAYRGPDGINYWTCGGNVGLAHLALHTTPESLREKQPLTNRQKSATLVADARVDNRDELIRTLTAKGYLQDKAPTDADLILAAYECWGEECPKYIIGDFAFAVWDAAQQKLFCARDPIGIRLLHYCQMGTTLLISTSLDSILAALPKPPPINRVLLQDMPAGSFDRWVHETAYETIFRLPQSYYFWAAGGAPILTRYWTWCTQPTSYKSDAEYIARYRELFQQAVQARMRSIGPVAILVGGGLDSSSVTCMVDHLIATRGMSVSAHLYSAVFDYTPTADEREYVEAVIEKCAHVESTLIPCDECWGLKEFGSDNGYPLNEPDLSADRALTLTLLRQARQDGCRVVMTGEGADNTLIGGPYYTPSLLMDIEARYLLAELPHFIRRNHYLILALLYDGLKSIAPKGVWNTLAYWRRKHDPAFLFQAASGEAHNFLPPPPLRDHSARESYRQTTMGHYAARLVMFDTFTAYMETENRLPFFDRRLVDFTLALPPRLRFRNGLNKYILREAMNRVLPEKVRQRTRITHVTDLATRGLYEKERPRIRELLKDARIARAGLVDAARLTNAWSVYWQSAPFSLRRPLIRALCIEAWLRHIERQT